MDKVLTKLNRIEGQVRGVRSMCEQGKDCKSVLQQIAAARSALNEVAKDLMADKSACVRSQQDQKEIEKMLRTYFQLK